MARGSKKKYTSKQKRKASKIEKGYKKRGVSSKEAERRAWATVNKSDKGGVNRARAKVDEKAVGNKARSPLQAKHRNRGAKHHKRNDSNRDP